MLRVTPQIESPCKLVCDLELKTGLCMGCGRSREEIAKWTRYTADERTKVMAQLETRMKDLPAPQNTAKNDSDP